MSSSFAVTPALVSRAIPAHGRLDPNERPRDAK
jgi:hypothetical protein